MGFSLDKWRSFYAMLWLHTVRSLRYIYNMIDFALVGSLWVLIYVLGALAFTPKSEYLVVVPLIYWSVIAWDLISTPVWVIGSWGRLYVAMGLYEEHELAGSSHTLFLSLKGVQSITVTLLTSVFMGLAIYAITGVDPLRASSPLLLFGGLILLYFMAHFYSLTLAFLGLATSVPGPLLDFLNFFLFIAGGVGVPISRLPGVVRYIALATPYSYPAEVMRAGVISGYVPFMGLDRLVGVALSYLGVIVLVFFVLSGRLMSRIRRQGLKGVGMT